MRNHFSGPAIALLMMVCGIAGASDCTASTKVGHQAEQPLSLQAFEGRYDHKGLAIEIVAHKGQLYAVIEDSRYLLRALGGDRFLNEAGQTVTFMRNRSGRVTHALQEKEHIPKLSGSVTVASRSLFVPRAEREYRYHPPAVWNDGLVTGSLSGPGSLDKTVASSIVEGVATGRFPDIHSVLIHHRGKLVMEEYFHGFDRTRTHQMRSLTKGIIALVAGAAVDRGLVSPTEAALPPLTPNPERLSAAHRAMTLADLLSMRSRLSCDDENEATAINNNSLYGQTDWIKAFLAAPPAPPGAPSHAYCSAGMLAAGRLLEVRSGSSLQVFADAALFSPLGISPTAWSWPFVLGSAAANEFGQIRMRPRDMMKIGVMVLQNGRFKDRQVISPSWISIMTQQQGSIDGDPYGYGVWLRDYGVRTDRGPHQVRTIMFSGNGGQKIYVIPSLELVVVATGGSYNAGNAPINRALAEIILPAVLGRRNATAE